MQIIRGTITVIVTLPTAQWLKSNNRTASGSNECVLHNNNNNAMHGALLYIYNFIARAISCLDASERIFFACHTSSVDAVVVGIDEKHKNRREKHVKAYRTPYVMFAQCV